MRKNWLPKKLDELGFVGRGRSRHRPRNDPSLYGGIYPFIQTADIMASDFHISKYSQTYNEKGLAQSKLWDENTLCMTIAGENTAETAILSFKACFPDSVVGFTADPHESDVRFVKYYLDTLKQQFRSISRGATQDNLSLDKLLSFDIMTPPLLIQRQIASILSAYDNLIENNTRRIAILEETARMLYNEWFVKFRFPGHEQVQMVESEMGMIPEGWNAVKLDEAIEIDPSTKVPKDGEKPFVPMGSLSENSMLIENIEVRDGNSGSKFKNGDTLLARITPCIENGKTGFVQFLPSADDVAFGSTEFIVLRSKTLCPEYVYLMARSDELRDLAIKSMSGATGRQRVRIDHLRSFFVARPDQSLLSQFTELVLPIFAHIQALARKNINLRRTRDKLLPKLISGEIDVSSWVEGGEGEEETKETVPVTAHAPVVAHELRAVEALDVTAMERPSLWE